MNTIKDLAMTYWNKLELQEQNNLLKKYVFSPIMPYDVAIENIFYQEVVVKWFAELDYNERERLWENNFDFSEKSKKEIYLKEHSEPQSVLKTIKLDEVFDGLNDMMEQSPLPKTSQPKTNEDVWDEVERILWNPDQSTGNKVAMLKAKFTLTKK